MLSVIQNLFVVFKVMSYEGDVLKVAIKFHPLASIFATDACCVPSAATVLDERETPKILLHLRTEGMRDELSCYSASNVQMTVTYMIF